MKFDFKFNEEKRVAVFTLKQIFKENKPILYVCHEVEDGAWQFLTGEPIEEKDIIIVALEEVIIHDPTVNELYDLPMGYYAERKFVGDKWLKSVKENNK
ncbi:MAG: hypothetical protein WDO71_26290 [Bacteroidota bacterium]